MPPDEAMLLVQDALIASDWIGGITEVVHGAASGIDTAAGRVAKDKWPVTAIPANWLNTESLLDR